MISTVLLQESPTWWMPSVLYWERRRPIFVWSGCLSWSMELPLANQHPTGLLSRLSMLKKTVVKHSLPACKSNVSWSTNIKANAWALYFCFLFCLTHLEIWDFFNIQNVCVNDVVDPFVKVGVSTWPMWYIVRYRRGISPICTNVTPTHSSIANFGMCI